MSTTCACGYRLECPCGCQSCPHCGPDPARSRVAGAIVRGLADAARSTPPDLGPWDD
jgi:hypothetical protein